MHYLASDQSFANGRALRQQQTEAEKAFWEVVRGNRLGGLKFRRQHPIGYFIADFYCHQYKLVIELDGSVHDEIEQQEYDQNRDGWMREYGLTILRFTNQDVFDTIDFVKQQIRQLIISL
ncbi:MAG: endonuclease domain-containing protein [Cytophagaceae bacterium]|nr:MAG: endonuclease domain-containing protein [Cytophagaceae bacterium]